MENLFIFLATSLVLRATSPKFKRYRICPGASSLLHSSSRTLHIRETKEGDKLYFNEYVSDGITYGLVCVRLQNHVAEDIAESLLIQYINRMRKPFRIEANVSMDVLVDDNVTTITDYWQDIDGLDWKIKGYTNGHVLSVLYVKNITDTSVKSHDIFLEGFKFLPL